MAWSAKASDLQRDPRYVLHSAVTGPDSGEGELKLYGSAVQAGQNLRAAAADAWWRAWPPEKAVVFTLHIGQAAFIDWDIDHGLMTVHRWALEVATPWPAVPIRRRWTAGPASALALAASAQGNRVNVGGRGTSHLPVNGHFPPAR